MTFTQNHRRLPLALLLSTWTAALGGLLFGFDTAVIAGTTRALSLYFHLSPSTLGITVSCGLWGTVVGGLLAAFPAERWGGRESLRLAGLLYLVSALGCAFAHHWSVFLVARFIGGLAIGGCSVFAPMYIAETSPASLRGRLVGCFQLSIVTGILVAYASNALVGLLLLGPREWRVELGVAALPSLLFTVVLAYIPRSPRWLVKRGRLDEAEAALENLGFPAEQEISRIRASLAPSSDQGSQSIVSPAYRRPLSIAFALGFFNQLSGINAVLYYANDIFARAGFTAATANQQAVAIGVANLAFTALGMALIDRLGRKPLLLTGAAGMGATLTGIALIFSTGRHQNRLLPLLLVFIAFFATSQGAVVWVYLSEIFPNAVRESGQSLASFWLWLLTAVVAGVFPSVAALSISVPFFFFGFVMVVQFLVVLLVFPETKGRSLEAGGRSSP
jgi:SP family arabinose:H+ symporter-like MFS transporter